MIQPIELLEHAKELASKDLEIYWRDSIKNAYYCLYHLTDLTMKKHSVDVMKKDLGMHELLIEKVRSINHSIAKSFARDLEILKGKRAQSCYRLNETITKIMAMQQVKYCNQVMQKLTDLDNALSKE